MQGHRQASAVASDPTDLLSHYPIPAPSVDKDPGDGP